MMVKYSPLLSLCPGVSCFECLYIYPLFQSCLCLASTVNVNLNLFVLYCSSFSCSFAVVLFSVCLVVLFYFWSVSWCSCFFLLIASVSAMDLNKTNSHLHSASSPAQPMLQNAKPNKDAASLLTCQGSASQHPAPALAPREPALASAPHHIPWFPSRPDAVSAASWYQFPILPSVPVMCICPCLLLSVTLSLFLLISQYLFLLVLLYLSL